MGMLGQQQTLQRKKKATNEELKFVNEEKKTEKERKRNKLSERLQMHLRPTALCASLICRGGV